MSDALAGHPRRPVGDARDRLRQPRAATRGAGRGRRQGRSARASRTSRACARRPRRWTPPATPREPIVVMPLVVTATRDDTVDEAATAPREPRHRRRGRRGAAAHRRPGRPVGGHAGAVQAGPRAGRVRRPAARADHPAGRLRLAGRRRAAAGARRRRRDRHRRDRLPARAGDGDVDLRHEHGLDARHRRRGRLLAVHPRPLPRGAARRPSAPRRRARRRCARPGWRWCSPA